MPTPHLHLLLRLDVLNAQHRLPRFGIVIDLEIRRDFQVQLAQRALNGDGALRYP